jgi:hypothetical protein
MLGGVRAWAVVVPLLAGLFAMHGVQAASGDVHAMPMVAATGMGHAAPGHAMAAAGEAGPEWGAAGMPGHGDVMCLALLVLLGFALGMSRGSWLARARGVLRGIRRARGRGWRSPRGPPVHLRLCVFRV